MTFFYLQSHETLKWELEDNCLFAHTFLFNDDEDEYNENNVFTNCLANCLRKKNEGIVYNALDYFVFAVLILYYHVY